MMGVGFVWVLACSAGARTDRQGTLFSGIEMIFPTLSGIQVLPDRLSRLPDRHPAAGRLLRAGPADRRPQLARSARQPAPARTAQS
jgi:hypothetical protein